MRNLIWILFLVLQPLVAEAGVMNPGEAVGQLVFLSERDVIERTAKYEALSPLSIPIFAELPTDLSVVAGAITLKQQNLLSHVQLKSRARGTPNLDVSDLPGGMQNDVLRPYSDGQYVHMILKADGTIFLETSTEAAAIEYHDRVRPAPVHLRADLTERRILTSLELSAADSDKVGSKAANYAELARALNSPERTVVRASFGVPFYYYATFLNENSGIERAIRDLLRDPLMRRVADVGYRQRKFKALQELILDPIHAINRSFVEEMVARFDATLSRTGRKRKMKIRSSTNSEDLPNFNGAGLYESASYQPYSKSGEEKTHAEKITAFEMAVRKVWASVWTIRAFEERALFGIPHAEVMMGIQVNPSFENEGVNGVVVTRNVAQRPELPGDGVLVESQRGEKYSVTNPEGGARPEQALILFDRNAPLDPSKYQIHVFQRSNVSDDGLTVLSADNPNPVMTEAHLYDLVFQTLKATIHFKPIHGAERPDFALDLEFKVDRADTGTEQIYLKQARPYVN